MAAVLLVGIALIAGILGGEKDSGGTQVNLSGLNPAVTHAIMLISLGLALATLVIAAVLLLRGLGWTTVKNIRSFDLLILTITMILPQLIAFPISIAGWNPLDYSQPGMIRTSFFLVGAVVIAAVLGLLWKPRLWLINMAIFYAIFTVFYTTFFTNGQGFFTGLVGSLGYWLTQQEVNRGSQPWYFFAFLQVPMYEYLPALGTITAIFIGIRKKLFSTMPGISPASQAKEIAQVTQPPLPADEETPSEGEEDPKRLPVLSLLVFWSVSSLIAYTIAGEKMPWLTVHITLPMLLAAGFGFGYLIDSTPFLKLFNKRGY